MDTNLVNKKELYKKVDQILLEEWDPIGVNDYDGANGEYRGYIPSIIQLLDEHAYESKIAKLLHQHAKVNMGLSSNPTEHFDVAAKLKKLTE